MLRKGALAMLLAAMLGAWMSGQRLLNWGNLALGFSLGAAFEFLLLTWLRK